MLVNTGATMSLSHAELVHFVRPSADLLFESAAASYRDKVICVVLTGTGEDGASGVRAVKKMGGTVIAEDEQTSDYFGMPGAAIATGDVDFVLPLDEIASALVTLSQGSDKRAVLPPTARPWTSCWISCETNATSTSPADKRPSLSRRIRKRMDAVQVETYEEYRDYLEVHPREHVQLVDTILINVTDFFRDEEAWRYLTDEVVPMIVARKAGDGPIRVWSAGCATGQEPYGLAMVLAEALGVEAFRQRVKIYATDTDDQALSVARSGVFTQINSPRSSITFATATSN